VKIRISDIPPKGLKIEERLEFSEVDFQEVGLQATQEVEIAAVAEKLDNDISIKGEYRVKFRAICYRCCEEFDYNLDKPFKFEYKVDSNKEQDLKLIITEDILLSLPSKILCKDDCKGLCAICAQNLNIDHCKHKKE